MKRMLLSGVACPELLLEEEEEEKERKEPLLSDFREEVLEDFLLDLSDGPKTNSENSEKHLKSKMSDLLWFKNDYNYNENSFCVNICVPTQRWLINWHESVTIPLINKLRGKLRKLSYQNISITKLDVSC